MLKKKAVRSLLSIGLTFFLTGCSQLMNINSNQFLIELQSSYTSILDLIMSFAYLAGTGFVVKSIFAFKMYGEQRTMMSSQTTIRTPLGYFAVGFSLLFLPKMISIMTMTVFWSPTVQLISYGSSGGDTFSAIQSAVYGLIQIMGLISIIRAFFLMSNPQPAGQGGGLAKALIHLFGGLIAVNIDKFIAVMNSTFT